MTAKHKAWAILLLLAVLLIGSGMTIYGLATDNPSPKPIETDTASPTPVQNQASTVNATDSKEVVTATGVIECLTPKSTSGTQTLSCAIGLKKDDGTHYALNHDDPSVIGSIPTGQRVQLSGTLMTSQDSVYDIVGIIKVASIKRL